MPNLVDLPRGAYLWTAYERDLYQRLPLYMTQIQVEFFKQFNRWAKLLKGVKWQPNMGFTMRGVHKNKSPVLRQQALPNPITSAPMEDRLEIRESWEDVQVYRQNFASSLFHFLPSFADFLTDSIDKTNEDIVEKMAIYSDLFYRTAIFHGSPVVWVCGKASGTELTPVPYWRSPTITLRKQQGDLQALIAQCTAPLDLATIRKLGTVMHNDIGVTPYNGNILPDGTNGDALKFKYCLVMGTEVWDSFTVDPFLLDNRMLNLDIVTDGFTGSLFGRFTALFERFEMRISADGSIPSGPENIQADSAEYDYGEPVMDTNYVNAGYGIAYAVGGEAYKYLNVGPPPSDFTGLSVKKLNSMNWNGKVEVTDQVMVPVLDSSGATVNDLNKRGEYLQLISDLVMGILPVRRRNIIPILYKRARP